MEARFEGVEGVEDEVCGCACEGAGLEGRVWSQLGGSSFRGLRGGFTMRARVKGDSMVGVDIFFDSS